MKTVLTSYYFDIRKPEARAQYETLAAALKAEGLECFETHGGGSHFNEAWENGVEVELETNYLFQNQWNTAGERGMRIFDWAQDYNSHIGAPQGIKRGHYLKQTEEMREIRRNTMKCGYCEKMEPAAKGYIFCPHCLDSDYLKSTELHLLRMQPVCNENNRRAPLTEAEAAHLLPLYKEAQLHRSTERGKARIAEKRASIVREFERVTKNAATEKDGFLWLMDRGVNTENCIFYDFRSMFSFGWRRPIENVISAELAEMLKDFPFPFEIVTE